LTVSYQPTESHFSFNTTSIPASSTEADRNTLQIAVRTKLKLIFRPKSLSDDVPVNHAKELSWSRSGNQVIVKNPSPFYINFHVYQGEWSIASNER
jgi:P pilus assembly chaperone PapD